jgi:hypothetical protein
MKARNFILAAATGMTLATSALAFDSFGDAFAVAFGDSMWTDLLARQQVASSESAPVRPELNGATTQAITGPDFDHETQSISRSLQRGDLPIATAATGDAGVAGSAGVVMGPDGQARDTGSVWFDNYVAQLSRRLQLDEPAFE